SRHTGRARRRRRSRSSRQRGTRRARWRRRARPGADRGSRTRPPPDAPRTNRRWAARPERTRRAPRSCRASGGTRRRRTRRAGAAPGRAGCDRCRSCREARGRARRRSGRTRRRRALGSVLEPAGPARPPLLVQLLSLAVGVHRRPVARMLIHSELAGGREALERLPFERRGVREVLEDAGLEDKEAAVHPAFLELRLLAEAERHPVLHVELAEARERPDPGYRRELAVLPVEAQEGREVDVGEPVAVRAHEGFLLDVAARAQQPAAG